MKVLNITDVFEDAANNGGGTYARSFDTDLWTRREAKTGYYVSLFGFERKIPVTEFYPWVLDSYINNRADEFESAFLGIWEDGDDVYLDVSIWCEDEETAERIANENMQLAYWDCFAGRAIEIHRNCGSDCTNPEIHRKH